MRQQQSTIELCRGTPRLLAACLTCRTLNVGAILRLELVESQLMMNFCFMAPPEPRGRVAAATQSESAKLMRLL